MTAAPSAPKRGVAGRIDYDSWQRRASAIEKQLDEEEEADRKENASALGLDGKHARSQAEADEMSKAEEARKTKTMLETYKRREEGVIESLAGLLGPPGNDVVGVNDGEAKRQEVKYVTRDMLRAGKRVLTVCDTNGPGKIVLTQDLSGLESPTPANPSLRPKSYEEDAENKGEMPESLVHRGLIKLNLRNLRQCTVVVKCKLITGTVEVSHCRDVTLVAEGDDATVVTVQIDLSANINVLFKDSPSGRNMPRPLRHADSASTTTLFWGEDKNDRIYHAGVSNMRVATYRDGYVDLEARADYVKDGASAVGNASAEEVQFVTSVVEGKFVTERLLTAGETRGMKQGARPITERELKVLEKKKIQIKDALDEKLKGVVWIKDKSSSNAIEANATTDEKLSEEETVGEVYASVTQEEIQGIVSNIEDQKTKGNEAFVAGEYAQGVLFYTMALDRAADLPDAASVSDWLSEGSSHSGPEQLFPRHIVLSNRSACFLKLGHHEKALKDASESERLSPRYVKGIFRKGLALHAMGRYEEAIRSLAAAQKIEPKNKQIKTALQFAEMRMNQERRKRMEG